MPSTPPGCPRARSAVGTASAHLDGDGLRVRRGAAARGAAKIAREPPDEKHPSGSRGKRTNERFSPRSSQWRSPGSRSRSGWAGRASRGRGGVGPTQVAGPPIRHDGSHAANARPRTSRRPTPHATAGNRGGGAPCQPRSPRTARPRWGPHFRRPRHAAGSAVPGGLGAPRAGWPEGRNAGPPPGDFSAPFAPRRASRHDHARRGSTPPTVSKRARRRPPPATK